MEEAAKRASSAMPYIIRTSQEALTRDNILDMTTKLQRVAPNVQIRILQGLAVVLVIAHKVLAISLCSCMLCNALLLTFFLVLISHVYKSIQI